MQKNVGQVIGKRKKTLSGKTTSIPAETQCILFQNHLPNFSIFKITPILHNDLFVILLCFMVPHTYQFKQTPQKRKIRAQGEGTNTLG